MENQMKQNLEAERVWQKNYYENNFVLLIECEVGGGLLVVKKRTEHIKR